MRKAAGFILYTHTDGEVRYLMLRNAKHGTWSFPKGHLEEGEELMEGARRELSEETGIEDIQVAADFEAVIEYPVEREARDGQVEKYQKRTHLFLARTSSTTWQRSPEHDDGDWMPGELALARMQHADLKNALLRAMSAVAATDPPR